MRDETGALATVRVCGMTLHFERRLRERLGIELTVDRLNQILSESKRIRRQQTVYRLINGEFKTRKVLGEFWHHAMGIIMLIDEWKGKAITVVTPADRMPICPKRPYDEKIARHR